MSDDDGKTSETAAPAVSFTLSTAERVRALVSGPPAYAARRRRIEDGEEAIVRDLVELLSRASDRAARIMRRISTRLEELNRLIDAHNRYYPIEANLPIDPSSGGPSDRGAPWAPMPRATIEGLTERASKRRSRLT